MESAAKSFAPTEEPTHPVPARISDLTRQLASGDEVAFTEFHARYFDRIYQFALALSRGNEHEARAATQDTLLRVARRARAFDDEETFWSWLKAVTRNAARDGGRKRQRYLSLLRRFTFQWCEPAFSPDDRTEESCLHALLEESLAELEPGERELMHAKYLRGASVKQLSTDAGSTQKAIESRLLRLRRILREAILKKLRDRKTPL